MPRPRLGGLLGTESTRLTLVSAPAGFGKTTLVTSWLSELPGGSHRLAWVSLDEGDRKGASFWAYVLTALERAVPGTGVVTTPEHLPRETDIGLLRDWVSTVRGG